MKVSPLNDRVLVKPVQEKEPKKGSIIIPDSARGIPTEGLVKAVGRGRVGGDGKRIKPDIKVGDKVLYGKYSGVPAKIGDEELLLMREDDILCVIEGK